MSLALLASAWIYFGACSSSSGGTSPAAVDVSGVVYVGNATDEGLLTLLGAKPVDTPSSKPVITSPAEGDHPIGPVEFSYRIGAMSFLRAPEAPTGGAFPSLRELFAGERAAHAHGGPMNGPAFLLTFSSPGGDKLLRIFTQQTSYLPIDTEWQRLVAAGEEITFTVTLALFDQGLIVREGGPFVSDPVHFTPAM